MTLLSRKRLMGISLIALVALSACTDDVDGDRGTGLTGHRLSFIVSMDGEEAQTRADGSGTTAATRYLNSVELKGRQGGKSVYLQAEETDGFPGDGQPLTRGTQINSATDMNAFAVSIYSDPTGTPDQMYNKKVENVSSTWTPEEDYYWSKGQKLSFFAWYPYEKVWNVTTDENTAGAPVLAYTVPSKVEEQQDLMTAVRLNQSETVGGTKLQFKHTLSAVRFISGSGLSTCTLHYIKLKGVKYKGSWRIGAQNWTQENETTDYTLTLDKEMDGTPNTPITEGDQTLLLMPQVFGDESAELEVNMTVGLDNYTFTAKLKDIVGEWKPGKTYTYKISDNLSDILKVDLNFFKGKNYTSHNISANGDPYTIDITYPEPNYVKKVTARFIYNDQSVIEDNIDLTGQTSVNRTSLCMNNNGDWSKARSISMGLSVQIKIESDIKVNISSSYSSKQVYNPVTDNDKWYTIWQGVVYPPNYIDKTYKVIMSRQNISPPTTNTSWSMNYNTAVSLCQNYYEVDANHPTYGTGKWSLPSGSLNSAADIHKMDILAYMLENDNYPGGNALYGAKVPNRNAHWTRADFLFQGILTYKLLVTYANGKGYSYDANAIRVGINQSGYSYRQFAADASNKYMRARAQIEY